MLAAIARVALVRGVEVHVVGGAVRDHLQGLAAQDIDLAVGSDPFGLARQVVRDFGGRFIVLDDEFQVGRLVGHGEIVDLALFKDGAATIEADLARRDFTVNSMAIPLAAWLAGADEFLDPLGGAADLRQGVLRLVSAGALAADPLRILRAYRLRAQTGFALTPDLPAACREVMPRLAREVAVERQLAELQLIMASARAGQVMAEMAKAGLLAQLFPELAVGQGVTQPTSHHLDVLAHNIEALRCLDDLVSDLERYFQDLAPRLREYLAESQHLRCLKWAALFHDVGKPATQDTNKGRITFYQHDQQGAEIFRQIGRRLRLANKDMELSALLVSQHMRPFHLCNIQRSGEVSAKACLRLSRAVGEHIPALFLLALADSLAGQGEDKPAAMEEELLVLFAQVCQVMDRVITPVVGGPPLLNGHDLIAAGLTPGPCFRDLLEQLEQLQVEGRISDRAQALAWLADQQKESG